MRLFWLMVLLAVAAAVFLYFIPDHGRQLGERLHRPEFTHTTDHLYQWRNAQGEWQVTDTPPPAGIEYQQRDYRDDVNVLPVPPGVAHTP